MVVVGSSSDDSSSSSAAGLALAACFWASALSFLSEDAIVCESDEPLAADAPSSAVALVAVGLFRLRLVLSPDTTCGFADGGAGIVQGREGGREGGRKGEGRR